MAIHKVGETVRATRDQAAPAGVKKEFPVREYIGAMALELGQMARWDGDETLGGLLDTVAALAAEPLARLPVEIVKSGKVRPA